MYKKFISCSLCIIFMIVCLNSFIGCTPFQLPTGIWICEKIEISIDFTAEIGHWAYGGIIYSNERNQAVVCKLHHITGEMTIYDAKDVTLEQLKHQPIPVEPLYSGKFQDRGAKKRKYRIKDSRKEYVFVKIE